MSNRLRAVAAAVVVAAVALPTFAQDALPPWTQTVYVYGVGAAIDGNAQLGSVKLPVDMSASDLIDALDFGVMAAYRIENDTWSFTGDVTYTDLGWNARGPAQQVRGDLDIDQLIVMASAGRRITPHLEGVITLAYFDLSTELQLRLPTQRVRGNRDAQWVDPLVGLHYSAPFADKWSFDLRGDIGASNAGSDFTWQLIGMVHCQTSDTFGWYVGYRALGFDYEEGHGRNYQRYDLRQYGPGVGIAVSF